MRDLWTFMIGAPTHAMSSMISMIEPPRRGGHQRSRQAAACLSTMGPLSYMYQSVCLDTGLQDRVVEVDDCTTYEATH
jgi:hypothetical protein